MAKNAALYNWLVEQMYLGANFNSHVVCQKVHGSGI